MSAAPPPAAAPIAERTRRRVTRRLMPFLFLLYIIAYIDRVNVGFAGLDMTRELHFSNSVFGFGGGIFFAGYLLLEIPGTILVERWSARKWIARIMITWGFVASATGLMQTAQQFYGLRFLLGLAEAGFFPGVIVYLTHWFRAEDRGKAIAMFMAAIPLSQVVGAPISAALLGIHWFGLSGWRWLLILEGLPAVILGIVTLFYLTDRPAQARWLPGDERDWLEGELSRERHAKSATQPSHPWRILLIPDVLLLTCIYFCSTVAHYGLQLWLPKVLASASGLSSSQVSLLAAIPALVAFPVMLVVAWHSDRKRERRLHAAVPRLAAGAGLLGAFLLNGNLPLALIMFSIAYAGMQSGHAPFWALPPIFLCGTAAAGSIGVINAFGNLGGFVGPFAVGRITDLTGDYLGGILFLVIAAFLAGSLVFLLRHTRQRH